jgi:hypothetical protein
VERKPNFANAKDPRAYCEMILLTKEQQKPMQKWQELWEIAFFTGVCNNKSNKNAILQMGFVATPFLCIYINFYTIILIYIRSFSFPH